MYRRSVFIGIAAVLLACGGSAGAHAPPEQLNDQARAALIRRICVDHKKGIPLSDIAYPVLHQMAWSILDDPSLGRCWQRGMELLLGSKEAEDIPRLIALLETQFPRSSPVGRGFVTGLNAACTVIAVVRNRLPTNPHAETALSFLMEAATPGYWARIAEEKGEDASGNLVQNITVWCIAGLASVADPRATAFLEALVDAPGYGERARRAIPEAVRTSRRVMESIQPDTGEEPLPVGGGGGDVR